MEIYFIDYFDLVGAKEVGKYKGRARGLACETVSLDQCLSPPPLLPGRLGKGVCSLVARLIALVVR
eukprot:12895248-Prorocentrum_lima.AAC.1